MGIVNNFLDRTPITLQIRERIDEWDCIKLKSFCTTKEAVMRLKRQPTESLPAIHLTRDL
jgi:hypothetical protein